MIPALAILACVLVTAAALRARPAGDRDSVVPATQAGPQGDWHLLTLDSLADVERLLDYLEANGSAERELVVLGQSRFAVRWR